MPTKEGFDELGNEFRCIWCYRSYPLYTTKAVLLNHGRKHERDRERAAEESAREKSIADRLD